jgi:hypothetical protein
LARERRHVRPAGNEQPKTAAQSNSQVQSGQTAQSPTNAPAGQPPTNPTLQATLSNIAALRTDFAAVNACTNGAPDPGRKGLLLKNLGEAAQGTAPTPDAIQKLANDLLLTTVGREKMQPQQLTLARDIHAVFNASHLSDEQQRMIFKEVGNILKGAGAQPADTGMVVSDLQEIADTTK